MSESGPRFYAWCDEAVRVDAYAAALSALVYPGALISVDCGTELRTASMDEAIARKPKGHDFIIDRRHTGPAVSRHMSVTGG